MRSAYGTDICCPNHLNFETCCLGPQCRPSSDHFYLSSCGNFRLLHQLRTNQIKITLCALISHSDTHSAPLPHSLLASFFFALSLSFAKNPYLNYLHWHIKIKYCNKQTSGSVSVSCTDAAAFFSLQLSLFRSLALVLLLFSTFCASSFLRIECVMYRSQRSMHNARSLLLSERFLFKACSIFRIFIFTESKEREIKSESERANCHRVEKCNICVATASRQN